MHSSLINTCLLVAALASAPFGIVATAAEERAVAPLDQGWNDKFGQLYYYTPQGSLLIPLSWLIALERADGSGRFADPAYLERFGWIYHAGSNPELNPAGLPIGFAVDPVERPEGRWAGFTCAACHTSEMDLDGTRVRVDGAPANLDVARFYAALARAVRATALDPARFQRFAAAVLGSDHTPEAQTALRTSLAVYEVRLSGDATLRHSPVAPGFGRVDALNQITNAIAARDLGAVENFRVADASVSIPHLWLAPKLDWVQWIPIASDSLGRNVGEVLGVFGSVDLRSGPESMFQSTALVPRLIELEAWLDELKSPRWPSEFLDPVDMTKAEMGKSLFEKDCAGCHNMPPWRRSGEQQEGQRITVGRIRADAVGTDPNYIGSFQTRTVATGPLAATLFDDQSVVPAAAFVSAVIRAVTEKGLRGPALTQREAAGDAPSNPCGDLNCLKAGALVGIWATGPFLHNGSVPTVYELLSPPEERRTVFWVGDRRFDAERLGFVSTEAPGLFRYDTSARGNGNGGHVFPRGGYTHDERMAVIEYLKDPNSFVPEPHL